MPARDDCNRLLSDVMPLAEGLLKKHGEFFPFGSQMSSGGRISSVTAYDGERPPSQTLIDLLKYGFRQGAKDGSVIATALVYDVKMSGPGSSAKSDAIAIDLDHYEGYSATVFFPYVFSNGDVQIGEAVGNLGEGSIFDPR